MMVQSVSSLSISFRLNSSHIELLYSIPFVVLYMNNIPTWVAFVASLTVGLVTGILVQIFIVPWQRRKILGHSEAKKPVKFTIEGSSGKCNESFHKEIC